MGGELERLVADATVGSGFISACGVYSRGGKPTVTVGNLESWLSGADISVVLEAFKLGPDAPLDLTLSENRHYEVLRADKTALFAQCDSGSGILVVKALRSLVLSVYTGVAQIAGAVEATETLASYLREKGR